MTALAANARRTANVHQPLITVAPVNAGSVIYVGAYVCREAATGVVIPGADAAGLIPLGVALPGRFGTDPEMTVSAAYDNTDGADGTLSGTAQVRCVLIDGEGLHAFAVESGTPKVGDPAYLYDDNTVDTAATTNGIIAGTFVQPAPATGQWLIDVSKRGVGALGGAQSATIADATAITGGESPTEAEHNALVTKINSILAALELAKILRSS